MSLAGDAELRRDAQTVSGMNTNQLRIRSMDQQSRVGVIESLPQRSLAFRSAVGRYGAVYDASSPPRHSKRSSQARLW